jgi:hypothetical protein
MSPASTIVVIAASLMILFCVAWFLLSRQHPERAAAHADAERTTTSDELYDGVDRPAGPDAELMTPEELGGDLRRPESP